MQFLIKFIQVPITFSKVKINMAIIKMAAFSVSYLILDLLKKLR